MREITYVSAIVEAVAEEMERDERVFLMGQGVEDGGSFKAATGLPERFGRERVRDVPISEDSVTGCAVGAAITGMRPILEIIFCDFTLRAMDQIANQAAKYLYMSGGRLSVPMVIRTVSGLGASRAAQHSQSLESMFQHFPGLKVVVPSTPYDVKGTLKSAIRDDNPVIVLESYLLYGLKGPVPEEEYTIPLGQADIKREGKDITIVALSSMVHQALKAAEDLEKDGVDVEVLDPRTIVPLDLDCIVRSVQKTNKLLVVEQGNKCGGVGAEIISSVIESAFDFLDVPPARLAIPNTPIPSAPQMEKFVMPNSDSIVKEVRRILE